jgi:N-acetylglucosaminyldiphosphoundecaprenol N-acetyl-beta-D-mannosaminyltransferase
MVRRWNVGKYKQLHLWIRDRVMVVKNPRTGKDFPAGDPGSTGLLFSRPYTDMSFMASKRVNVLGVGIHLLNLTSAMNEISRAIRERRKGYICVTGVHGVMEAQADPAFRRILNGAFLCTPDGMPMVWMGRIDGYRDMGRVYGPDLMLAVCQWSETSGCRHFFYGGAPGVADELRNRLTARFPRLQVVGCYTPPFRALNSAEEHDLGQKIRDARPDILWVGLSTPKQEKFMAQYLSLLDVTLMIGVGAAFDFHSGRARQSPRWMQRSGLEWFFRLCQEPRRLGRRYLKNNPLFLLKIAAQLARLKKYSLE